MAEYIACMATTGVVERGGISIRIGKEAIESFPNTLNGERSLAFTIDHDPLCMPIGKTTGAWVEPLGDEYAVMARIHVEDAARSAIHMKSRTELVHLNFVDEPRPFIQRVQDANQNRITVGVDLANFDNPQSHATFVNTVTHLDEEIACTIIGRHSVEPEPLIQLILSHPAISAALGIGLWTLRRVEKFIRYTIDETSRKLADELSESLSSKIKAIVEAYKNQRSDDRRILAEIVVPGDMTLVLLVEIAHKEEFQAISLYKLTAEMEKYGDLLRQAEEATFAQTQAGEWEFQYLTTRTGEVFGTAKCYKRTMDKLRRITKRPDTEGR